MPTLKKAELRLERSFDPIWWVLAATLGLGVMWLPQLFRVEADSASKTLMVEVGLFFSGALMGALRPHRVWRWPLATFLAFGFADLVRVADDPKFHFLDPNTISLYLANHAAVYAEHTLPVLLGAYLGCYLSTEGTN